MRIHCCALILFATLFGTNNTLAQEERRIAFEGADWLVLAAAEGKAETGTIDGRDALFLSRAQVWRDDLDWTDLVIEYEVMPTIESGFIGVNFRADTSGQMEQFYVRPHQSGSDDATQYQPIHNGLASWQIYGGPNDIQATDIKAGAWLPVKIVVIGDAADIFVGDAQAPLLHVPDLKAMSESGAVGLFMGDRFWIKETGAWFSKIRLREAGEDDRLVGTPREEPALPEGLIRQWEVSAPFAETRLEGQHTLVQTGDAWRILEVEPNGVANLGRLNPVTQDANTVLVRTVLTEDEATVRRLRFGYSDRVRLYLNGEEIFAGNAGWRSRDHRHLGTVTWVDTVPLRREAGRNELVAAVSESFGGWGFTGAVTEP